MYLKVPKMCPKWSQTAYLSGLTHCCAFCDPKIVLTSQKTIKLDEKSGPPLPFRQEKGDPPPYPLSPPYYISS
jgi:hypothetical protein